MGDYSGRFGELNGSGREVKTENKTGVVLADFIGLSVFVMGGGKTACGTIMPTFGKYDREVFIHYLCIITTLYYVYTASSVHTLEA